MMCMIVLMMWLLNSSLLMVSICWDIGKKWICVWKCCRMKVSMIRCSDCLFSILLYSRLVIMLLVNVIFRLIWLGVLII